MFAEDFAVVLQFQDVCEGEYDDKGIMQIRPPCRSHCTALQDICSNCRAKMPDEIKNWEMAHEILKNHNYPTMQQARKIIKNQEQFIAEGRTKQIIWNSDDYKIGIDYFMKKNKISSKKKNSNQIVSSKVSKFNKYYENSKSKISNLEQVEEEKYPANEEEEEKQSHLQIQDKDPLRELRNKFQAASITEDAATSMIEKKVSDVETMYDQSRAAARSINLPSGSNPQFEREVTGSSEDSEE